MMAILVFILILSILVILHELGHFLMAKRAGIGVEEFGIGLPPRIWGKKIGETIYSVNWLPFGGFVRLVGEDPEDKKSNQKNSFYTKSIGQRMLVVVAGVVANFALAVVIFYIVVAALGYKVSLPLLVDHDFKFVNQTKQVLIADVSSESSNGDNLSFGESIFEINGEEVDGVSNLSRIVNENQGKSLDLLLEDPIDNDRRVVNLFMDGRVLIRAIEPGSPAAKTEIELGDYFVSVNGRLIGSSSQLQDIVKSSGGEEISIVLEDSQGNEKTVVVAPRYSEEIRVYVIGVSMEQVFFFGNSSDIRLTSPRISVSELFSLNYDTPSQKIFAGFIHSYNTLDYSVRVFAEIIGYSIKTRDITPVSEGVAGPVGIAAITSQAVSLGWLSVAQLVGLLSLNLAVINILPIPALDGGRFAFIIVEAIAKRRVYPKVEKWAHTIGFALLLALILLVTYNDILKLVR